MMSNQVTDPAYNAIQRALAPTSCRMGCRSMPTRSLNNVKLEDRRYPRLDGFRKRSMR